MTYSISSKLMRVRDALNGIETTAPVFHYRKPADEPLNRYIIWAEESGDSFGSNNRNSEVALNGSIDVYTQTEFDELIDQVANALNESAHISFSLNSVDYDDETNLIHYEFLFSVA